MLKLILIKMTLKIKEMLEDIDNLSPKEFTTKLLIITSIMLNLITLYIVYS